MYVLTQAMMIKMIDAFVAKFAVHGLFVHLDVTDPTLLGGIILLDVFLSSQQSWIRRIDGHGAISKIRRSCCESKDDERDGNAGRHGHQG
jgi:hypothetical protein